MGCGFGGKGVVIIPNSSNPFAVNDFPGFSSSSGYGLDSHIGRYVAERGGSNILLYLFLILIGVHTNSRILSKVLIEHK